MEKIYNLISDVTLDDQFVESFKIRNIDQKLLYLDEGAELYYLEKENDKLYDNKGITSEILNFLNISNCCFSSKKNLFIGLGCGKSYMEAIIFDEIFKNKIDLDYFGIDGSKNMLDMSIKSLKRFNIHKEFILADFFSRDFKNEILRLSENYDSRLYTIFNNTFGNLNQTRIINNLNNLLRSGDKLWIDVRMKSGNSMTDDLKLFNNYCESLKRTTRQNFFDNLFGKFGISKNNYSYYVSTHNDNVLGSLVFDFVAKFGKKTCCEIYGNNITILPNEEIKINHIYTYDTDSLVGFFKEHGFVFLKKFVDKQRGHFIFEKI